MPPAGTVGESGTRSGGGRQAPCFGGRCSLSSRLWRHLVTEDSPGESRGRHGRYLPPGLWAPTLDGDNGEHFRVTKFWQRGRDPVALTVWLLFLENPYLLPRSRVIWENSAAALLVRFPGCPAVQLLTDELRVSRPLHTAIVTTMAGPLSVQVSASNSSSKVLL